MAKQLGFYMDASACTGCKACMVACKDKNDLPVGINWRTVYEYEGGEWVNNPRHPGLMLPSNFFVYSMSVACMHCQDAKCVAVCPAGAMVKDANGLVSIDADKCIGCRYCEWACPYGAPSFNEAKGVMTKCNGCADYVAQGLNPACVDACPMRAIEFGDLAELRGKHGVLAAIEPLPSPEFTNPSLVVTPHWHAQASGTGSGHLTGLPEEG
jgi:anaerobic dimethyl sulfoxide reductase subunit B (iron-sulfur subunit)